ncbi:site-specific DNA-methyltransferase [Candidatus Parcubacteria bacterium]|jgi:site-specific DNA-methyltransferase (adenine-specific)|nr:site-specific DNA-methyltransferase [Candidatus Parcubacteria bacterium]
MNKIFLNKIKCIDCLKGLGKIDSNSIDLIITSPPYNLGNDHHTGFKKHKPYEDNMKESDYQDFQLQVLNECFRVLKNNGSIFYNHKNRIKNGSQISPYEWLFKTNFLIKQELVWINRSQNFHKIRFYPWTERIYWLVKDRKTVLENNINHHDVFDWKEWRPVGIKGSHTRAFPEKMVEDILSCFPKSKIVLDPFVGSGTTMLVAKRMKKKFIGFENNKKYCNLARKRLYE